MKTRKLLKTALSTCLLALGAAGPAAAFPDGISDYVKIDFHVLVDAKLTEGDEQAGQFELSGNPSGRLHLFQEGSMFFQLGFLEPDGSLSDVFSLSLTARCDENIIGTNGDRTHRCVGGDDPASENAALEVGYRLVTDGEGPLPGIDQIGRFVKEDARNGIELLFPDDPTGVLTEAERGFLRSMGLSVAVGSDGDIPIAPTAWLLLTGAALLGAQRRSARE